MNDIIRNIIYGSLGLMMLFVSIDKTYVYASSDQAYRDYLYQFDLYRATYNEFQVARNEYLKFKTLVSETTALEKTKKMMPQRNQLLRSYMLLLNEKLNEDNGLSPTDKQLYQTLIGNEATFLDKQAQLISSIGALGDAERATEDLEQHYYVMQGSMRQTIIALALGQLNSLSKQYDAATFKAQGILSANPNVFSLQKRATIDRWILQITNKRSIYQQKVERILRTNAGAKGSNLADIERTFGEMQQQVAEARQYLVEGSSYLTELMNSLRYLD